MDDLEKDGWVRSPEPPDDYRSAADLIIWWGFSIVLGLCLWAVIALLARAAL